MIATDGIGRTREGARMGKRKATAEWGSVDWSQQDVVIAARLGVSRERVRQVRPPGVVSPRHRRRTAVTAERRIAAMDTSRMTANPRPPT